MVQVVVLNGDKELVPMKSAVAYRKSLRYDKDKGEVVVRFSRMGKADMVDKRRGRCLRWLVLRRSQTHFIRHSTIVILNPLALAPSYSDTLLFLCKHLKRRTWSLRASQARPFQHRHHPMSSNRSKELRSFPRQVPILHLPCQVKRPPNCSLHGSRGVTF